MGGGVGTRPWGLARLACGGAYWPLAFCHDRQAPALLRASALPWGGEGGDVVFRLRNEGKLLV